MYGQGPPFMMPPQVGFGYQQQLVPGMRPGGGPMPSYFVPMVQQGLPRQRVYRYPPGRNNIQDALVAGGMMSYDMGGLPLRDLVHPENKDIRDIPGLAPPVMNNRRLLWNHS
ncbi:hypothetical protein TSUD_156890 [Trifolium subterraneum]|uniref:Uncharacterized protein n=1 Tax=Trifolium subterraneum TaxID=3900 RepID=A0A2Z6MU66_TRISU|nr:hypothetical protein TSUD_156890 [Trifolium subterraneum]